MNKFLARAKVVVTALPTRLAALAVAITAIAPVIAGLLPEHAEDIGRWAITVVGLIGSAVAVIRRVTPVLDVQVGILPQGPPAPPVVVIDQTPPVDTPDIDRGSSWNLTTNPPKET